MLFDFLKSFQNAPFCMITCKDFDKISGKTRFKRVNLKIVLIGEKEKSRFDNDVIILAATMNSSAALWRCFRTLYVLYLSLLKVCWIQNTNLFNFDPTNTYLSLVYAFAQSGLCRPVH